MSHKYNRLLFNEIISEIDEKFLAQAINIRQIIEFSTLILDLM
jgi:hypothetical protein